MAHTLPELFEEFFQWAPVKGATKHKCRSAWLQWQKFRVLYPDASAAKFQVWLRDHAGYPASSVHSYTAAVSQVYRWLADSGEYGIDGNPFDGVKRIRGDKRQVHVYGDAEINALLDAVQRIPWRDPLARMRWTGFVLLGRTGLREGEIWNLRWDHDLDLASETVHVQYRDDDSERRWWRWGTKGASDRDAPMSEDLVLFLWRFRVLAEWPMPFLKRRTYELRRRQAWPLPETVRNYPYGDFWREFRRIRRVAKIGAGTFHRLRKDAGTLLVEEGVPLPQVQAILGHKSMQTTREIYVYVDQQRAQANARAAFNRRPLGPVGFEPTTKGL
jgi:integrase